MRANAQRMRADVQRMRVKRARQHLFEINNI
jgi:hypothetical protein